MIGAAIRAAWIFIAGSRLILRSRTERETREKFGMGGQHPRPGPKG